MSRRPFLVDVVALRRHPGYREHLVTNARLDGMAITEAAVPDDAPVGVDVLLEAVEGGVVVKGTASYSGGQTGAEIGAGFDKCFYNGCVAFRGGPHDGGLSALGFFGVNDGAVG